MHDLDGIEQEMTQLWGHINAAKCRFLELLAEFDRRDGWGRHGCASCAHWLNWQCGIGMVAAREYVRVARALSSVPTIHAAFREARISYSKVRAMTRIATPETEDALLNVAVHGTAHHVERLVGKYRSVERREAAARAGGQYALRGVEYRWDEDGSMTITAKLPAEVGEIVRRALEAAIATIEADSAGSAEATNQNGDCRHTPPEVGRNVSAEACAAPEGATYTHAPGHQAPHTDPEHREPLTPTMKRADGLRLLAERFLHQRRVDCGTVADRFQVVVHIDQASLASDEEHGGDSDSDRGRGRAKQMQQHCELEHGPGLALDTARRLACDATVVGLIENGDGHPLNVGRRTRSIPPALRRALASRDGGCRFPGCDRHRFTEGHHIVHWANGGETSLRNLVTLCHYHHRLIHESGFAVRMTDDGALIFTRPDGSRIGAHGARGNGPAAATTTSTLIAINSRTGLAIDANTIRCRWGGESMDYHMAVGALIGMRDRAASTSNSRPDADQ